MVDETKQVSVILGPYRGNRLTMPTAEADQAVNDHWAVDPYAENPEPYPGHPPLSDEERTAAVEAATAWAHTQWGWDDDPELEPLSADETGEQRQQREQRNQERLEQRRRDMQAGQPGAYRTRQVQPQPQPPQPQQPPQPGQPQPDQPPQPRQRPGR